MFFGGVKGITQKPVDFKLCLCLLALGVPGNGFAFINTSIQYEMVSQQFWKCQSWLKAVQANAFLLQAVSRQKGGKSVGETVGHIFEVSEDVG